MTTASCIPRRIFQTARSRDLSPLAKASSANIRLLHPDWEYSLFDDHDIARFVADQFPQYNATFDSFPHKIQKIDFFRYLVVLKYGGFYFDLDVFLYEPLDNLLSRQCVFPFEEVTLNRFLRSEFGLHLELGNYGFGSSAGAPFLAAVVENCVRAQKDHAWAEQMFECIPGIFRAGFDVLNTTGPGIVTRTLGENLSQASIVSVLFPAEPCDIRDRRNWHQFGRYGIHLMDASWREKGSFLRRKAAALWETHARNRLRQEDDAGSTRKSLPTLA